MNLQKKNLTQNAQKYTVTLLTVLVDMTLRHHMSNQGDMFHERYISLLYHISADSNFRSAIIFRYIGM